MFTLKWTLAAIAIVAIFHVTETALTCNFIGEAKRELVCKSEGKDDQVLCSGIISDNNQTYSITIKDAKLATIKDGSFKDLFGLRKLDLSNNIIEKLQNGVFEGADLMTHLDLSFNKISDIEVGVFASTTKLELLNLKGNQLVTLREGLFDSLDRVGHIDLSTNSIDGSTLSENLFKNNRHVAFIDFSGSDMSNAPAGVLGAMGVKNLLNLDSCHFREVPKFAITPKLKTMRRLFLSSNEIREIMDPDTFINLKDVEEINLYNNQIDSINDEVFNKLKYLKVINVSTNRLATISGSLFQNMKRLSTVNLSGNLMTQLSADAFIGTALNELDLQGNNLSYLSDNFCTALKDSGVKLNKFYFSKNPWQCKCLYELINEVKSMGVDYNSEAFDGKEAVCVSKGSFKCKRGLKLLF